MFFYHILPEVILLPSVSFFMLSESIKYRTAGLSSIDVPLQLFFLPYTRLILLSFLCPDIPSILSSYITSITG
jgi:hypothetical protein